MQTYDCMYICVCVSLYTYMYVCTCIHPCIHVSIFRYCSSQHTDYVHGLSWHPHQPHIITCGWDGQVLQHEATAEEHVEGTCSYTLCNVVRVFRVQYATYGNKGCSRETHTA